MKIATDRHLATGLRTAELYFHFPITVHGVMFHELSQGKALLLPFTSNLVGYSHEQWVTDLQIRLPSKCCVLWQFYSVAGNVCQQDIILSTLNRFHESSLLDALMSIFSLLEEFLLFFLLYVLLLLV